MELIEVLQNRRSVRKYTGEPISQDKIEKIIQAGLLSPSGRNLKPWELVVVRDKETLKAMVSSRTGPANMLAGAEAAIVVIAKTDVTDVWTEDCSIVMFSMHVMADSLGLGSCWIQSRLREAEDGGSTEDYLKKLLDIPAEYNVEAMLSLGVPESHPARHELEDLPMDKVHWDKY